MANKDTQNAAVMLVEAINDTANRVSALESIVRSQSAVINMLCDQLNTGEGVDINFFEEEE